ncbi:peptidase M14 carboxypeptidase A [Alkalihalophilus pseudofirmus OF4]|uniref:Peptidase M14 carboxypeptidase A n=1 Tax=Alkalihalophilus pseudofirmus (strain ATCC BAA-2126 / JCM 17055 / OF4) TaxID=398511 RepID=D3FZK1_ALKPO|nr:M14 family zinc carboxypeptidase [Alkalihalophilus pseudofirmus]ADC49243.1 peptidase M14 carboxypeptidase A [Alkalihalophilus pseudofirmus OF4]
MSKRSIFLSLFLSFIVVVLIPFSNEVNASNIVNPKQVYSFEQMERDIVRLAETYPEIIEYKVIGESEYGRPIYAVKLGNGLSTSYINASNHAREWISTNLTMNMIDQYAQAYRSNRNIGSYNVKNILDFHSFWFVPMMNPDGVTLQQRGLSAFPSSAHSALITMNNGSLSFQRWKANARGIDLNRQFNANWNNLANDPGRPSWSNHRGSAPHTAKEVKAVLSLTNEIDPEMAVSYHSSGEILFWNFHQSGAQLTRDRQHARAISSMTGYTMMGVPSRTGGGGYTDWFIQEYKRPAFTPELAPYVGNTHVPLSYFDRIWNQNRQVGLYVGLNSHRAFMSRFEARKLPVSLEVNGNNLGQTSGAFSVQGRTLVPVRSIFEELGATLRWDSRARKVYVTKDDISIEIPIHKHEAIVNGQNVSLDAPAMLLDGRTFVPLRFISEAIGANVQWNQQTRHVKITLEEAVQMTEEQVTIDADAEATELDEEGSYSPTSDVDEDTEAPSDDTDDHKEESTLTEETSEEITND